MSVSSVGFHRISFMVFSIIAIALVACTQVAPPVHKNTLSSDPVVRWIQQNAVPLRTVNPGGSDSDLASLQRIVGTASIVGLGEATHGTHEFYNIKARLAEFLITKLGFTTFIMENNWGTSQLIDAYINGGSGNIDNVMQANLFTSWQTQEYRAFLEWMRAYNANPVHITKLHFLGMDCQGASQSDFDVVENYLQKVDRQQAITVQQLYRPIITMSLPDPSKTYVSLSASTKQQYQNQAQKVYDLLKAHQQDYINHSSPQSFALALQNARIIVQFTTYFNQDTQDEALARYYQRDTFMAENVVWLHNHNAGSKPKIIVWAHDAHIANNTLYGSQDGRNMGGELRARYKDSYLSIGTTFYQGAFRVYHYPETSTQQIPTPNLDTYNYNLGQADLPLYMLDLRKVPSGPVATWANEPTNIFLNYGLGGENLSTICTLSQWFDVIIHVQRTTPSNLL